MKIALNKDYGCFMLNEEQEKNLKPLVDDDFIYEVDYNHKLRTNKYLIETLEKIPSKSITIIEIPDNATDFIIDDYDGFETVYFVVDGKIKRA